MGLDVVDIHRVRHGRVADYDAVAGYGHVESAGERWWFHCSAIADGSRRIEVGTPVRFRLVPGHLGRHEARDVTAASSAAEAG
ncbi:MAG TPA: hypothetical protein VF183_02740 [Acidimicrobiales bacterium]